jgi:hypothetical protein
MTVASLTVSSLAAQGSSPAAGRGIYVEGNRYVGRFRVTIVDLYETGGGALVFKPETYGFPAPVASVSFTPHLTVANVLLAKYQGVYDFVNKKILIVDVTDGTEPNTDDLTGLVLDVTVVSE